MPSYQNWRRKLRWLVGRGWSADDFAERYRSGGADVWGYRASPAHVRRAEAILAALPQPRFARALEVGCAQGFLSERLASRVDRLIACDISSEAIAQARENGRPFANAEFHVADIRAGFPAGEFDLCLFSDVLYYLSARENDAVLREAARKTRPGGYLLIVNEWTGAAGLTPPSYVFARLDENPDWERVDKRAERLGEAELALGVYRRAASP